MSCKNLFNVLQNFFHFSEGGHIMISYQHKYKDLIKRVADILDLAGFNVWLDVQEMSKFLFIIDKIGIHFILFALRYHFQQEFHLVI